MNADVVKTQFRWMAQNSIDGAAVQRFAMDFKDSPTEHHDDVVLQNVRAAAEATGRVFYLTYDVSGMKDAVVGDALRKDWRHLVNDLHVTSSPRYLRYRGKPVLQIWGYGFSDGHRPIDPVRAAALISDLKRGRAGLEAVTLVGGVPSHWRTLDGDSVRDPRWAAVYRSFDVISPWSVGRFANQTGADNFLRDRVIPDMAAARRAGVDYMPVIFPGYSFHNASRLGEFGGWFRSVIAGFFFPLNEIPRECGRFYWRQVYNLLGAHATILYAAMFDEVDEGTALFKTVRRQGDLPRDVGMVSLDEEGCSLPSDWYLQLTGRAGDALKSGRMPSVSLAMPTERSKR
jgi:hypothetical protein